MTKTCRLVLLLVIFFCLAVPALGVDQTVDPQLRISELEAQNENLHQQLRQVRRQLAVVKNAGQEPGWPQILGGVGIIFGICGIGMMVNARKK